MRRLRSAPQRPYRLALGAAAAIFAALLAACEPARPPEREAGLRLTEVGFGDLPGWRADQVGEALPALERSCERLLRAGDDDSVGPDGLAGTVADWRAPCRAIAAVDSGDHAGLRAVLEQQFVPFRVADGDDGEGLFTGYYEPVLEGARFPGRGYDWAIYGEPDDLVRVELGRFRADLEGERVVGRVADGELVPYYTRAEIAGGALDGRNLELLWVDDPVDAFFLHVQGSGRVRLPDGETVRVGYAASNGREFTGIGRRLLASGAIDRHEASMQAIRDWLRAHPERAREFMQENARYIFFRLIDGAGPIGTQGVPLTAGRSLAVDPDFLPLGAPVWLDTAWPGGERPLRRLMVAQDTGAAIQGAVRGDIFFGGGEEALAKAGRMKQAGRYYLLLPRAVAERRRPAA